MSDTVPKSEVSDAPRMTAAAAMASTLAQRGVDIVYCLPGEETIVLLEEIQRAGIELIVTRHEQQAAFMAAAHGRLTGRPGVVVTTLGPGFTNALTGLAQATLCGFPLLAIAGQKQLRDNEEGSFQVLDLPALARPVTKHADSVTDGSTAAAQLDRAFSAALAPRQGATFLEVPEDIAGECVARLEIPTTTPPVPMPHPEDVRRVQALIRTADRPIILAGSECQFASGALTRLAEMSGMAVVSTQMGKGSISEKHPNACGSLNLNSQDPVNHALDQSDLVVAIGYQPVEHPPLGWNRGSHPVIHVNTAPAEIERAYQPQDSLIGDLAVTLSALANDARGRTSVDQRLRWAAEIQDTIAEDLDRTRPQRSFPPNAAQIAQDLRTALAPNDVVALDNGVYKLWFARHYQALAPHTLLLDNALATMGAGLATAMVAAHFHPDQNVVAVCGDGGFMMNVAELETARRMGLDNLVILVLRDDAYGFIAWHQEEQDQDRTAVDLSNPDLVALAGSFGIEASRVDEQNDLNAALTHALAATGPTLIDCPIDQTVNDLLS